MLWYLIKYNPQGMWTEVSIEISYDSAEARMKFLNTKVKNVNYMIVTSPQGKQYLPQVVEYKLSQLKQKAA
jgi:hypothetical protein